MTDTDLTGLRVLLIGEHPWAGFLGVTVSRCDPDPQGSCLGHLVKLDNGPMVHAYQGQWELVKGAPTRPPASEPFGTDTEARGARKRAPRFLARSKRKERR